MRIVLRRESSFPDKTALLQCKPRDAEQLPSRHNFQSAPHNHLRLLTMSVNRAKPETMTIVKSTNITFILKCVLLQALNMWLGQTYCVLHDSERLSNCNWATSWQNQQNDICAQRRIRSAWASAKSDQRLRCRSVRMEKHWVLSYPLSVLRRPWSD